MKKVAKIGVLTSGGDCGGLNAAIRSIFIRAKTKYLMEVYGIKNGTLGLIKRPVDIEKLSYKNFEGFLIKQGGTFLGTNSNENTFKIKKKNKFVDASNYIISAYHSLKLDALIVIGGDGSMKIMKSIADKGKLNIVGIPKTIDNDLGITEYSIGFHTAVDAATRALDSLQSTAASHGRAMILEVMGRDAGHIALNAGIAGAADIILIPELDYTIKGVVRKLNEIKKNKIRHFLIVVAEATTKEDGKRVINKYKNHERLGGIGQYIAKEIMKSSNIECRVTSLGHIQRGAAPVAIDRILASAFGVSAVDLVAERKFNRLVAWNDRKVIDVPIEDGISAYRKINIKDTLLKTALSLGIYLGKVKKISLFISMNKNIKKIIFTDLDESLLNKNKFNKEILSGYIKNLIRKNFLIIPISSKTYQEVIDLLKDINFFFPFSTENGSAFYIPENNNNINSYDEKVHPNAKSVKQIKKILFNLRDKKYYDKIHFIENMNLSRQRQITKLKEDDIPKFINRKFSIPILWRGTNEFLNLFKQDLFFYKLNITFGGKMFNISGDHNKLDSIKFLEEYFTYRYKNIISISIGDSPNDLDMLQYTTYSGIVKNSNHKILLNKKKNVFRSKQYAPEGWVELIEKIKLKMEIDYN